MEKDDIISMKGEQVKITTKYGRIYTIILEDITDEFFNGTSVVDGLFVQLGYDEVISFSPFVSKNGFNA